MSETERILIKEVLNEIYIAGDELQTYKNLLNKIMELKEPTDGEQSDLLRDPYWA